MEDQFQRTRMLIGEDGIKKLRGSRVLLFGVGGVGGYVAEALARAGIGAIDLVDNDTVSLTNINRQIIALHSTIGKKKVDVMRDRILDINPKADVTAHDVFLNAETLGMFDFQKYSYVVDAIDNVTGKLLLAQTCENIGIPIISCMGAGNKLDPGAFVVTDVFKTSDCPLARVMRRELKKLGVKQLKTAYSREKPIGIESSEEDVSYRKQSPGSMSAVPGAAGLVAAGEVIKDLLKDG